MANISREQVANWLGQWAENIQRQDYVGAAAMFSADCIGFGTVADQTVGLEQLVSRQWQRVWERTRGFAFDIGGAHVILDADMAVAMVQWTSTGFDKARDDALFERTGRATIVLRAENGTLVAHHTHFSISPLAERFLD